MRLPLVIAAALLVAGCSTAASRAAAPATASAPPLPSGCATALSLLPSSVPATAQQADAAYARLGGVHGTTLDALRDKAAADLFTLGFDLQEGGDAATAVSKYETDVSALRAYCA